MRMKECHRRESFADGSRVARKKELKDYIEVSGMMYVRVDK